MKHRILIGTLASYYGISKQTLIHYDRIGLLKPSAIAENNYRYYTFEDIDKLDVILHLKDTGLSLEEIHDFLQKPSIEESLHLLKNQTQVLEERILHLERIKKKMHHKIEELEFQKSFNHYTDVKVTTIKERYILKESIHKVSDSEFEVAMAIKKLKNYIENTGKYNQYSHSIEGVTVDHKAFTEKNYSKLNGTFIFLDHYSADPHEDILDAATYACILHYGLYENTYESYEPLLDYINANGFEVIGDAIEIPLITAWTAKKESDYITEIQLPVKKISKK